MKFKNKVMGFIEETNNDFVIEQFKLRPDIYEEIKETPKKESKTNGRKQEKN